MDWFHIFLWSMIALAAVVFVALHFIEAGYGMLRTSKWGFAINNKTAWFLMEFPVFTCMCIIAICCPYPINITRWVIFGIFQLHYIQRAFIFPWLLKGKGKMPIGIMLMGVTFNVSNAVMQGYWLFYVSMNNNSLYTLSWLSSAPFLIGTVLFLTGFIINIHADYTIRHLRKNPSDTAHYLPKGGLFRWITSANYFGELIEWLGFAILTWSLSGFAFFIWTFANLVPRAAAIYKHYQAEFGKEMTDSRLKRIIPRVY
jgi:3-oxo-5-alpha-steroid 4-dehydrogenase 1